MPHIGFAPGSTKKAASDSIIAPAAVAILGRKRRAERKSLVRRELEKPHRL